MKTSHYLIAFLSFLIISCSPEDDSLNKNNLIAISKKLSSLDPSVISNDEKESKSLKNKSLEKNKRQLRAHNHRRRNL